MARKNKKSRDYATKILSYFGSLFLVPFLSIPLFIVMIPFLTQVNGLPQEQMANAGGENLWKIVGYYGLFTLIIASLTFYKRKLWQIGAGFITYWIIGIIIVMGLSFMLNQNSSMNNQSSNQDIISDWNSCNEQVEIQKAKSCTFFIQTDQGSGTGFAIKDNFIVTNFHVIEGAREINTYTTDSGEAKVPLTVWGYSDKEDLAILKIDKAITSCKMISSNNLPLAETLYAVGWPLGLSGESSITKGAYSRKTTNNGEELIQTDASINPGNSGGPLASRCGIVGINQAIIRWSDLSTPAEGLGFAITSSYAKPIIENLIINGSPKTLPLKGTVSNIISNQNNNTTSGNNNYSTCSNEDIINIQNYLYKINSIIPSWEKYKNTKGGEDVNILLDSLYRQRAFTSTVVENYNKKGYCSGDDLNLWNAVIKMSYESGAITSKLNSRY